MLFIHWIIATISQRSVGLNVVRYQKGVSIVRAVNVGGDVNVTGCINGEFVNGVGINDGTL